MPDELVFSVVGSAASPCVPVDLSDAGLREREHLQEWVIANPEIIGSDVFVVTTEFDRWESRVGVEHDRLDILGLDTSGHLVITELKRDAAPDTVAMQAIKYAAMASRFDEELLADAHVAFLRRTNQELLTSEEALELMRSHTEYQMNADTLRAPRIVLIAGSFPTTTTATAVWLSEMGLDMTLVRVQAYRLASGEIVVTVSQHYPPPDVEAFTVAPTRAARRTKDATPYPEVEWTQADYTRLAQILTNVTILAAMDMCAKRPGEWIPFSEVIATSGRDPAQARGDTGGFSTTVRTQLKRSNWPFEHQWAAGGERQSYYRMSSAQAAMWKVARGGLLGDPGADADALGAAGNLRPSM